MDTTGLQEAAEALNRSDAQFRRAMENAPVGMALVDLEWRLMAVNRAFATMMGATAAALRGTPFSALSHPHDVQAEREQLQRLYDGLQSHFSLEKRYVRADGNVVWAVLDVALVRYAGGAPDHYVVQVRDSTDDRLHSELMAHRAMHDPLTGLANRRTLDRMLELEVARAGRQGVPLSIAILEIDHFSEIQKTGGNVAGDEALRRVAQILAESVRLMDTVARFGNEQFILVAPGPDGLIVAERLVRGIAGMTPVGGKAISVSAGIAGFPLDGRTPDELLVVAEKAMHAARQAGGDRVVTQPAAAE
jgi:diguanylate cyclase (GGDEF)-like protein/PAS domain S-box-containing protein